MFRRAWRASCALVLLASWPAAASAQSAAVVASEGSLGGSVGGAVTEEGATGSAAGSQDAGVEDSGPEASSASTPVDEIESGFEHGLRLGVSLPFGKTGEANVLRSGDLSGVVGVRVPIWLDLGYRLDRTLWVGIAPELGLGTVGSDCEDGQECEWTDLRLSAQALWHWAPSSSTDPWLGVGLGWESLRGSVTLTAVDPDSDLEVALRLRELLQGPQASLQAGLSFDVGEALTVGPYLAAAAGMFLFDDFDCPNGVNGCPTDSDVESKQVHAWLGVGVRGTHGP